MLFGDCGNENHVHKTKVMAHIFQLISFFFDRLSLVLGLGGFYLFVYLWELLQNHSLILLTVSCCISLYFMYNH